jgi:heme-degrading monooxygenase HmoA
LSSKERDLTQPPGTGGPVTTTVTRRVKPGHEREYEEFLEGIIAAASRFPGYLGVDVIRPDQPGGDYRIVYRFDSANHLRGWVDSAEPIWTLAQASTELRARLSDDDPLTAYVAEATACLQQLALERAPERIDRLRDLQTGLASSIQVALDGPYLVTGAVRVRNWVGESIEVPPQAALCRCGESKIKPFCQGGAFRLNAPLLLLPRGSNRSITLSPTRRTSCEPRSQGSARFSKSPSPTHTQTRKACARPAKRRCSSAPNKNDSSTRSSPSRPASGASSGGNPSISAPSPRASFSAASKKRNAKASTSTRRSPGPPRRVIEAS